jgi:hypothetical protein
LLTSLEHRPQTTLKPFSFLDKPADGNAHEYVIAAVDAAGRNARSEAVRVGGV